jgi:hypothetical protein
VQLAVMQIVHNHNTVGQQVGNGLDISEKVFIDRGLWSSGLCCHVVM